MISHAILKGLRRLYCKLSVANRLSRPDCVRDPDSASAMIAALLDPGKSAMIARFGSNEINAMLNYLGVSSKNRSVIEYVRGRTQPWWWHEGIIEQLGKGAGFFPLEEPFLERFCKLMMEELPLVDLLGSWRPEEHHFAQSMPNVKRIDFELLVPLFSKNPWTKALKGKKVLVIHPFASTIRSQYLKKDLIFPNGLLPDFELSTIQAVQSVAGQATPFPDWFKALDSMKNAMDAQEYDIALIGCGAYGFPLAAHAKRTGKVGFHIGGSLQLLFGIRGQRWERKDYNHIYDYSTIMNEYWVRPGSAEKPKDAEKVENACYW